MKTEQENRNTGFHTGFKYILTDLVMCKKFSIYNMVSREEDIILFERLENYGLSPCCLTACTPS